MVTDLDDDASGGDGTDENALNGVFSIISKQNQASKDFQPDDLTDVQEKEQISTTADANNSYDNIGIHFAIMRLIR